MGEAGCMEDAAATVARIDPQYAHAHNLLFEEDVEQHFIDGFPWNLPVSSTYTVSFLPVLLLP